VPTRAVSFTTSDHVTLAGKLFGHGSTYIILSNQTDTVADSWDGVAQQLAARGYSALAYDYRGKGDSQGEWLPSTPLATDLRAAVAFARGQGARQVVVMGASIGGAVTATVAADGGFAAVIILSSPSTWPGLEVTDKVLRAITAPKLFLNSARDDYAQNTQAMYDAAQPPKEIHIYPDIGHGIGLFNPASGYDTMQRVLTFLAQFAPAS
jgi:alpha-beta hydrolase superfamily lysophospholipase